MAGRAARRATEYGLGIGGPLLAAVVLALLLRGLFPIGASQAGFPHPSFVAGGCLAGQLIFVGWRLDWSVEQPSARLTGVANAVTILRGALYAVVAGFVVVPPATDLVWVPALAYGTGMVLDQVDGRLARTVGEVTNLGEELDMAFDTFGFVAAPLLAVVWGQLPVWYLTLAALRYVYCGARWWRRYRGKPLFDPPESDLGKYFAGMQMLFLTAALVPVVPTRLVWALAPVALAPSVGVFLRDYLVVSGRLSRQD